MNLLKKLLGFKDAQYMRSCYMYNNGLIWRNPYLPYNFWDHRRLKKACNQLVKKYSACYQSVWIEYADAEVYTPHINPDNYRFDTHREPLGKARSFNQVKPSA